MVLRVAINGFGRIGRNALRALYECERLGELNADPHTYTDRTRPIALSTNTPPNPLSPQGRGIE